MHAPELTPDREGAAPRRELRARVAVLLRDPRTRLALKVVATLLALVLAAFSLHGVPLSGLVARLGAFPRWGIAAAIGFSLAQVALLATRLWLVLPRGERPSFLAVLRAYAFGQLGNGVLPGRTGDVIKVVALSRGDASDPSCRRPSLGGATGALLADRALDLLAFVGLAVVAGRGLIAGAALGAVHAAWIVVPVLALAVTAAALLRRLRPGAFARVSGSARGTVALSWRKLGPGRASAGVLLGAAGWLAELASMVVLGEGLGLHLSLLEILRGLVVLNLGITVPVSIANVGTYEAATVAGLASAGVSTADAVALGALHHVVQLLAVLLPALVFWARDRLLPRLQRAAAEVQATPLLTAPAT